MFSKFNFLMGVPAGTPFFLSRQVLLCRHWGICCAVGKIDGGIFV